jgi:rhodanese-related sulfurtransferase
LKHFIGQLCGGAALIVVSLLIGIAYNTFISNKVQLLPAIGQAETVNAALSDTAATPDNNATTPAVAATPDTQVAPVLPKGVQAFVPLEKAKALFDGKTALFIDARGEDAFEEGHIPGAMNVPYDQLVDYYESLTASVATDRLIVVYCWSKTCDFSDSLASELVLMGYTNIVIFRGGWEEWQAAGFPTEPPAQTE